MRVCKRADGPVHLPVENDPLTAQVQPLDAVALAAPGIGNDIFAGLLGGGHDVKREC